MQTFLIYGNLATRRLTDSSGNASTLPSLVQGDIATFSLRLLDQVDTDSPIEVQRNVRSLRGSIGNVSTAPSYGQFSLRIGANGTETPLIDYVSERASLKTKLAALPETATAGGIDYLAEITPGCWMIRFGNDVIVPLQGAESFLSPISFIRVRPFRQNGRWWHELRLLQAPIAYSGLSDRVLAEPPSVRRIRAGSTTTEGGVDYIVNEVQAVKVPASFRGTYCLKFEGRTTIFLSKDDDPTAIETALNNLFTDGQTRFGVTNPEPYNAYVEFKGPLSGEPQDLLVAEVGSVEPGDLTFSLDLNTAEVFSALRDTASVQAQFEIELEIANDDDPPDVPGKIITLFREPVTITRELQWAEMAAAADIDWLRPPQPKDYIPFTRDQIITGSQHYVGVIGDGVARAFTLDHNLGTDAMHITLRENTSNGRRLADTEYLVTFVDTNSLVIAFPDQITAPAANAIAVTLTSTGPKSAFQAHTHTEEQIVGLIADLDSIRTRLSSLEAIVPNIGAVQSTSTDSGAFIIPIAKINEALFLTGSASGVFSDTGIDGTKLSSRAPFMLPAVHTNSVGTVTALPLPSPAVAQVWQNNTGGDLQVPGGGMVRGSNSVPASGFIASDGRMLFRANQAANTISYFPAAFERPLWNLYINEKMLGIGKTLAVQFGVNTQLIKATSQAQWMLVIEKGEAPSEGTSTETNLLNVLWDTANPILKQRIILTPTATICYAGCNVYRSKLGVITCDRIIYGGLENANTSAPSTANFALRARLIEFDTENSVPTARGWVAYQLVKSSTSDLQASIS